ncbi:apr [Scenedesmus sp. PABB004]|nr:apr [Scenedesmus sp. PABB004]
MRGAPAAGQRRAPRRPAACALLLALLAAAAGAAVAATQPSGEPRRAAAGGAGGAPPPPLRAFVVLCSAEAAALVAAHARVRAVVPDLLLRVPRGGRPAAGDGGGGDAPPPDNGTDPTFEGCARVASLARGVPAVPGPGFAWPGCHGAGTRLLWAGERCGEGLRQVRFTALLAVSRDGGELAAAEDGAPCVLLPDPANRAWTRRVFGAGCGAAPGHAPGLPTRICAAPGQPCFSGGAGAGGGEAGGAAGGGAPAPAATVTARMALSAPVACGDEAAAELTYTGVRCGPGGAHVRWVRAATPGGCALASTAAAEAGGDGATAMGGAEAALALRREYQLFGSCGVPPGLLLRGGLTDTACLPPLAGAGGAALDGADGAGAGAGGGAAAPGQARVMPKARVLPGELVPAGVEAIGAAAGGRVADVGAVPPAARVCVAVVDCGVDASHPDLNYVAGLSWLAPTPDYPAADDAGVDAGGHGTAVAGVAGARNNGAGTVGVSPGVGLWSLKVSNDGVTAPLSAVLSALAWAAQFGRSHGIRVEWFHEVRGLACPVVDAASAAGLLVVAAAGNDGADMHRLLPNACPGAAAVSHVNNVKPGRRAYAAKGSNWLPASAPAAVRARIIAAPGSSITSTASLTLYASGYNTAGGSSFAAPHVAGVAANCVMSGGCGANATGGAILATLQAAAAARAAADPAFGFRGDPSQPLGGRYYGWLVASAW